MYSEGLGEAFSVVENEKNVRRHEKKDIGAPNEKCANNIQNIRHRMISITIAPYQISINNSFIQAMRLAPYKMYSEIFLFQN